MISSGTLLAPAMNGSQAGVASISQLGLGKFRIGNLMEGDR